MSMVAKKRVAILAVGCQYHLHNYSLCDVAIRGLILLVLERFLERSREPGQRRPLLRRIEKNSRCNECGFLVAAPHAPYLQLRIRTDFARFSPARAAASGGMRLEDAARRNRLHLCENLVKAHDRRIFPRGYIGQGRAYDLRLTAGNLA
jgi:hypothetical protein